MDYILMIAYALRASRFAQTVLILIVLDVVLGVSASIMLRKVCSAVGIDGIIRKATMLLCLVFFVMLDVTMGFNLIGWLHGSVQDAIGIDRIGLCEFFSILFIAWESLSCCKNFRRLGLPLPKKMEDMLDKLLTEMTEEGE